MHLVSFDGGFGRVEGNDVVPMGPSLVGWLAGAPAEEGRPRPLAEVRVRAPVPVPGKVLCIGVNYRDHAAEMGRPPPETPVVFAKFANAVIGPGDDVVVPAAASMVDYEAELAVVVGRRAARVAEADALSYVAGYACCNDVSSRALQFASPQWTMGKAVDTFLPFGPVLVTADEVPDPQALGIRCLVNGEVRQSSDTGQMVFGVAALVSFLSSVITLEPGDVIATGTPAGVAAGRPDTPWLVEGDEVVVEIDGLGRLANRIRAE